MFLCYCSSQQYSYNPKVVCASTATIRLIKDNLMKLKHIAASALLAVASVGAYAGDTSIFVIADGVSHNWDGVKGDGFLSGYEDIITFGANLAPGTYSVGITVSGQNLKFNTKVGTPSTPLVSTLNGTAGWAFSAGSLQFFGAELEGASPFVLSLKGTALAGAGYSGTYTVTAVPEPATYGMLLGGLALVGFAARRKKAA